MIDPIAAMMTRTENEADTMHGALCRAAEMAREIATRKIRMAHLEREAREQAGRSGYGGAKNSTERDDAVMRILAATDAYATLQREMIELAEERDRAYADAEYHKILARTLVAGLHTARVD